MLDLARRLDAKKNQWGLVNIMEAWSLKQPWRDLYGTIIIPYTPYIYMN